MIKLILTSVLAFCFHLAQAQNSPMADTAATKAASEPEWIRRIKFSGYLQTQFQLADSAGQRSFNGGNFQPGVDKRFMVRRGRVKIQHDGRVNAKGISPSQFVVQFDVTEKGVNIKDAYVRLTDPWTGWVSITTGMQNRPFGYEIIYSSSLRESPERGRMSQVLFPNERDLGAMLAVQGPAKSGWNWLRLEAGYFNGNGAPSALQDATDFDKYKDFIGHLFASHTTANKKIRIGGGISYYYGGYRIDSVNVYRSTEQGHLLNATAESNYRDGDIASRKKALREYVGVDAQFSVEWIGGTTTLRGEYIQGSQPGTSSGSTSPLTAVASDIYNRKFNGAYFYFVQNILKTPLQAIAKYDWYDPNTDTEGNRIGMPVEAGTRTFNAGDVRYDTWGFGLAWLWDASLKLTAYYEVVKNETSVNSSAFNSDVKDNLLTLRAQYKF